MAAWIIIIIGAVLIAYANAKAADQREEESRRIAEEASAMRMQIRHDTLKDHPDEHLYLVDIRGELPLTYRMQVTAVISVLDTTQSEDPKTVYSLLESFQEKATYAFQSTSVLGEFGPGAGSKEWVNIGFVPRSILVPPKSGRRKIAIVARLYVGYDEPGVSLGFGDNADPALIWTGHQTLTLDSANKGYLDVREEAFQLKGLAVQLALAVAGADGHVADEEGLLIKGWMQRAVQRERSEPDRLKALLNDNFLEAYRDVLAGNLVLSRLIEHIGDIGDKQDAWTCLELCYEVIAADGVATAEELALVRRIADSLGISADELESLQDQKLVGTRAHLEDGGGRSLETVLGIDASWDRDRTRKHLRDQFRKWNDRMAALQGDEERASAQQMLELIAEARRRYG